MSQKYDGLLPVHKPDGMISKDVSRWLTKRLGRLSIGHVGTLDPGASGVLPLLLGRATKLQDWLLDMPKSYDFELTFGIETDTLDRDGRVIKEGPYEHVTELALKSLLSEFIGEIEQIPPAYSAVKYKGKPLYDYARSERLVEIPELDQFKRRVRIHQLELLQFDKNVGSFRVRCSKGTYVRSLVKDIAEKVGSCGTLTKLVRTEAAGIKLSESHSLETIEAHLIDLKQVMISMSKIDIGLPKWRVSTRLDAQKLRNGQRILVDSSAILEGLTVTEEVREVAIGSWDKPLFLVDENGIGLGIGTIRRHDARTGIISMKRGF